ncbi:GNAT family N-acetyltransferase [Tissierella carlieri]|uniref:GNAT family N-acetyltransferase n=1 Tax=Tissierella carlieri TaxID=689904 RepID=A0ABT1SF45_9FIRM|nr:GNAT family protein [Tissierella carlieri]MBU5313841.1 GNAT family N-acetyltransferase [Tissierella carlieri]MCQ4925099.1 GNAT family N-acetyltransferase [Tissierella carlieri]
MKTLETERTILRTWKIDDIDDFYEYAKNPNIGPSAGWEPHENQDVSMKILQLFIEKDEVWAIEYKANNKVIGSVGAHIDEKRRSVNGKMIGYVLSEDYWGQGIMGEVVKEVVRHLFDEENCDIISCYHYPFNSQSKRVIEKSGFQYEGTLRLASKIYDGRIYDDVCYSITREEYLDRKQK